MPEEFDITRTTLASRLREAREYVGLSQDEVARFMGIPRPAVSLLEKGERRVDALELKQLAALYQRDLEFFTGKVEASAPEHVRHLARLSKAAAKLKPEDLEELTRFAQFLQSKANQGKQS